MKNDNLILTLGTAQDGGFPHIGCNLNCCRQAKKKPNLGRLIASLSIVDTSKSNAWIIDVTPDISKQLRILMKYIPDLEYPSLSGVFLTHAHIGHYIGLLYFGLEALNLKNIPVYVLPGMKNFLCNNSMFSKMIENNNIIIKDLSEQSKIRLNDDLEIEPFFVPHRNELSETVGYSIKGESKSLLYIPDIDSWEDWNINLVDIIKDNDIVIIDGTFFSKDEVTHRNIEKIPHPSIIESISLMKKLSLKEKNKVFFTHLNHTNKALNDKSEEYNDIITTGYNILKDKQTFRL